MSLVVRFNQLKDYNFVIYYLCVLVVLSSWTR